MSKEEDQIISINEENQFIDPIDKARINHIIKNLQGYKHN